MLFYYSADKNAIGKIKDESAGMSITELRWIKI